MRGVRLSYTDGSDLGTLEVRRYTDDWDFEVTDGADITVPTLYPTSGPANRYRYALFIEKEGFAPLLEQAQIAARYDMALMSTKGMTVTAARELVERLSRQGVTVLVMRDFDKAGFSIVHTLSHSTRRYRYERPPAVIDLGLRLADVKAMGLEGETVEYEDENPHALLRKRGTTEAEVAYLVSSKSQHWHGKRVELNELTSEELLAWLDGKLNALGVQKVLPDDAALREAYKRAVRMAEIRRFIGAADNRQARTKCNFGRAMSG
jgi:DNA topoisomerase VI subunit A